MMSKSIQCVQFIKVCKSSLIALNMIISSRYVYTYFPYIHVYTTLLYSTLEVSAQALALCQPPPLPHLHYVDKRHILFYVYAARQRLVNPSSAHTSFLGWLPYIHILYVRPVDHLGLIFCTARSSILGLGYSIHTYILFQGTNRRALIIVESLRWQYERRWKAYSTILRTCNYKTVWDRHDVSDWFQCRLQWYPSWFVGLGLITQDKKRVFVPDIK